MTGTIEKPAIRKDTAKKFGASAAGLRCYLYDADGNRIRESIPELPATGRGRTALPGIPAQVEEYTYNAANRMTGYSDQNGAEFEYAYDALGRRTTTEQSSGPRNEDTPESRALTYFGTGFTVLEEAMDFGRHGNNLEELDYIVGPGGRAYGALTEESNGGHGYGRWWNEARLYSYDIRGSLSAVITDDPPSRITNYAYDAFGTRLPTTVNGPGNSGHNPGMYEEIGYTGYRMDSESGLWHAPYREYDAGVAGFTTEDPIKDGSLWYLYCAGNPICFVDIFGLAPGDPFTSAHEAARDAINYVNPTSISSNQEYAGLIYYSPANNTYSATTAVGGSGTQSDPFASPIPTGAVLVGDYHTHGNYSTRDPATGQPVATGDPARDDYNSDNFSPGDISGIYSCYRYYTTQGSPEYYGYLGTPSGEILYDDPRTSTTGVCPLH